MRDPESSPDEGPRFAAAVPFQVPNMGRHFQSTLGVDLGKTVVDRMFSQDLGRTLVDRTMGIDLGKTIVDRMFSQGLGNTVVDRMFGQDLGKRLVDRTMGIDLGKTLVDRMFSQDLGNTVVDRMFTQDLGNSIAERVMRGTYPARLGEQMQLRVSVLEGIVPSIQGVVEEIGGSLDEADLEAFSYATSNKEDPVLNACFKFLAQYGEWMRDRYPTHSDRAIDGLNWVTASSLYVFIIALPGILYTTHGLPGLVAGALLAGTAKVYGP